LFRVFPVFPLPPHDYAKGVIHKVGFRSRWLCRVKERGERTYETGFGPHHMARKWVGTVGALPHLVAFHVDFFFFSFDVFSQKNDVPK
jgi:hypothetical protein